MIMNGAGGGRTIDSLVANEFTLSVDGQVVTGIFRVVGLTTLKLDADGGRIYPPVQIVKMVQRDGNTPFNKWLRESVAAETHRPTRTVVITAVDDGTPIRRWSLVEAQISEVSYSEFNTASGEMIEERVTVSVTRIEESWLAAD